MTTSQQAVGRHVIRGVSRAQIARSDWFTVRVLLAGNLVVFGVSYALQLGVVLAVSAVLLGLLLLVIAIRARVLERRMQGPKQRGSPATVKQESALSPAAVLLWNGTNTLIARPRHRPRAGQFEKCGRARRHLSVGVR